MRSVQLAKRKENKIKVDLKMLFIIFFTFLLFLCSCKKSTEQNDPVEDNGLFRASITNNWPQEAGGQGIMFISEMNGDLIEAKTWSGDSELKFDPPASMEELPDFISVTTAIQYDDDEIELETFLKVPVSYKWIYEGGVWTGSEITLEFQNVPSEPGYLVASTLGDGGDIELEDIMSGDQEDFYYLQGDIYILVYLESIGAKYRWFTDVQPGETHVIDLSTITQPAQKSTITLPYTAGGYRTSLIGYPEGLDEGYDLDDHSSSDYVSSFEINYPSDAFSKYRTRVRYYDEDTRDNYYQYIKFGEIPTSCAQPTFDFLLLSISPINFSISTSGVFDRISSRWEYEWDEWVEFEWIINGPPDMTNYELPDLPEIIKTSYEGIEKTSFNLDRVYIRDWSSRESYSDILSAASDPDSPYDDYEESYQRVKRNRD